MNQEIGKIFIRAVSLSYFLLNQFDLGQCFLIVQNIQMFHLVIPPPATSWKPENRRWVNREVLNFLKTFHFWKKGCTSENGDWIVKVKNLTEQPQKENNGCTWGKGGCKSRSLENTSPNLPWFSRSLWGNSIRYLNLLFFRKCICLILGRKVSFLKVFSSGSCVKKVFYSKTQVKYWWCHNIQQWQLC